MAFQSSREFSLYSNVRLLFISSYSSKSSTPQVRVFSTTYTIADRVGCYEFPTQAGGVRYQCHRYDPPIPAYGGGCGRARGKMCTAFVNVTERIESIDEWHSRFQKPITKLIM
jgi:hypothetical protein